MLVILGAAGDAAASWTGDARATGVVFDETGAPLAGAEVRIDLDGAGPEPAQTGDDGRWRILGLAPGRWHIIVRANGYLDAEGRLILVSGANPESRITLQREEVRTKNALEGRLEDVEAWIAEGDRLLDQREYAAAREKYEKALPWLPSAAQPDVLSSIARTWYLEGAKETAVESLERALRLKPTDAGLRKLLEAILGELGRAEEAKEILARIEADPDAAAQPETPPEVAALLNAPAVALEPGRTGQFRVRLERPSKWSTLRHFCERSGMTREEVGSIEPGAVDRLDLAREAFQVFVPDSYSKGAGFGVLVWVSPSPFGGLVRQETKDLIGERKLIWIGADNGGNARFVWDRWRLAIDAAEAIRRAYDLDPDRIYVGGYSGGGRVSSWLTLLCPEVFRGGLFLYGADDWVDHPVPDRPGTSFRAAFRKPPRRVLDLAKSRNRFVFVEGEFDINRVQSRLIHGHYRDEGFAKLTWLDIPGASHFTAMPPRWFRCALEALDAPVEACVGNGEGGTNEGAPAVEEE